MELFIPSVLVLLLAAAIIFFVLPRFGAPALALISVGLLVFGIYQHMNAFGNEYRLSTWQLGLMSYAPFIMIGGLLLVIGFYLLTLSPLGKAGTTAPNMPEMPSVAEMPNANTATNAVTAGVNNALKGITNVTGNAAAALGLGNAAKAANNKGVTGMAAVNKVANTAVENATKVANTAITGITNAAKGITNAVTGVANTITGNNKGAGLGAILGGNTSNKGTKVPGLNFPLSQV